MEASAGVTLSIRRSDPMDVISQASDELILQPRNSLSGS